MFHHHVSKESLQFNTDSKKGMLLSPHLKSYDCVVRDGEYVNP